MFYYRRAGVFDTITGMKLTETDVVADVEWPERGHSSVRPARPALSCCVCHRLKPQLRLRPNAYVMSVWPTGIHWHLSYSSLPVTSALTNIHLRALHST